MFFLCFFRCTVVEDFLKKKRVDEIPYFWKPYIELLIHVHKLVFWLSAVNAIFSILLPSKDRKDQHRNPSLQKLNLAFWKFDFFLKKSRDKLFKAGIEIMSSISDRWAESDQKKHFSFD